MTIDRVSSILRQALQGLTPEEQQAYMGEGYLKLQELDPAQDDLELARQLGDHLHYRRRQQRRQAAALATLDQDVVDPDPANPETLAAAADLLATLNTSDRAILALILAGYSQREAASRLSLSAATICRRLQRLRQEHQEERP